MGPTAQDDHDQVPDQTGECAIQAVPVLQLQRLQPPLPVKLPSQQQPLRSLQERYAHGSQSIAETVDSF